MLRSVSFVRTLLIIVQIVHLRDRCFRRAGRITQLRAWSCALYRHRRSARRWACAVISRRRRAHPCMTSRASAVRLFFTQYYWNAVTQLYRLVLYLYAHYRYRYTSAPPLARLPHARSGVCAHTCGDTCGRNSLFVVQNDHNFLDCHTACATAIVTGGRVE